MVENKVPEDDIGILSTNYAPTVEEALAIRERLKTRDDEIRHLEALITTSESQELRTRHSSLQRISAVGLALLAPIRRLPEELLAEIMVLVMPPILYESVSLYIEDEEDEEDEEDLPHHRDVRRCLVQVCHAWKKTLLNTPRAWASLCLDHVYPLKLEGLGYCLQMSKARPLDIKISPQRCAEDQKPPDRGLRLIRQVLPRLRSLLVCLSRLELPEVFPPHTVTDAPLLKILRIDAFGSDPHWKNPGPIHAPNLETLELLYGSSLTWLMSTSLPYLSKLVLSCDLHPQGPCVPSPFLQFLKLCPGLKILQMELHKDFTDLQGSLPSQKITLGSLEDLQLTLDNNESSTRFCELVHAPILKSLHVNLTQWHTNPEYMAGRLTSLLADSATSLHRLSFNHGQITGDGVESLLRGLVNLQQMDLHECTLDEAFLTALTPDSLVPPSMWLCPRLATLHIVSSEFSSDRLIRLVGARTQSDVEDQLPGYLTRISGSLQLANASLTRSSEFLQLKRTHSRALEHLNILWC